jgi:hypothetical protein
VKATLARDGPARYQWPPKGSVADAFEPRIRELLASYPQMPSTVIAQRIGWPYSVRWPCCEVRHMYHVPGAAGLLYRGICVATCRRIPGWGKMRPETGARD